MTESPRRPGPESTLDEVRAKLIDAGVELVRRRGVDVGLSEVSLSDTIAAAGVTRSTAYRSLADDTLAPQAFLHRELMTYLLARYTRGDTMRAIQEAVGAEIHRQADALASADLQTRTHAVRSVIRVGANLSYQGVIESPERSILTAIYGALQSATEHDWRHDALVEGERGLTTMFAQLYDQLADSFGFRIKPAFTNEQFAAAGASLIEGMAMRNNFNDYVAVTERPTGPGGALEDWTLFAISFEALFVGMFEPKDSANPFADLGRFPGY